MDVDPIDGGPAPRTASFTFQTAAPAGTTITGTPLVVPVTTTNTATKEEEARQAIDLLSGDDVAGRVLAASRLDAMATVLGPERTREVGHFLVVSAYN